MAELVLSGKDFKALSSKTRIEIIKLLGERNYNLSELSLKLKMSVPTIKQHINILESSGLVFLVEEGRKWKYYSLTKKGKNLIVQEQVNAMIVLAAGVIGVVSLLYWFFSVGISSTLSYFFSTFDSSEKAAEIVSAPSAIGSQTGVKTATEAARNLVQFSSDYSFIPLIVFVICVAVALIFHFKSRRFKLNK